MSQPNPWRLLKQLTAEVAEIKATIPKVESHPPLCVVCCAVATDPERRPVGIYSGGREYVYAGDAPDPQVLEWLTRPQGGQSPLVIVTGPESIPPPPDEDS